MSPQSSRHATTYALALGAIYQSKSVLGRGDRIAPLHAAGEMISVDDLLP